MRPQLVVFSVFKGLRHRQDRGEQRPAAAEFRQEGQDVRVRGAHRRQEAHGHHQRNPRERQVPARAQAARERGKQSPTHYHCT